MIYSRFGTKLTLVSKTQDASGKISLQATAEGATYDEEGLLRLLRLARIGCERIFAAQAKAVGK